MWLIVLAVVVVALGLLVASVLALVGRLRPLRRAVRKLQIRADEVERIRRRAAGLEESLAGLQAKAAQAGELAEKLQSARSH